MKNDLSCDVVRDLLPSYIDGLTSEESNKAVKEHLSRCGDCMEKYKAMCPEENEKLKETQKEIDYLLALKKKNRKKLRKAILITAGSLLIIFALVVFSYNFLIGSPAYSWSHRPAVRIDGSTLYLEFINPSSAHSYAHWEMKYTGIGSPDGKALGEMDIRAREVLSSPIYPSGSEVFEFNTDEFQKISFMGRTIWENGLIISTRAEQLQGRATAFVGSAPDVRALLDALKLPDAGFTISLQTDSEPYGLTLIFNDELNSEGRLRMVQNAPVVLALIDNLGEFSFCFPNSQGGMEEYSFTAREAGELLPKLFADYNLSHGTDWEPFDDIKDCSESPYLIQQLLNVLDY